MCTFPKKHEILKHSSSPPLLFYLARTSRITAVIQCYCDDDIVQRFNHFFVRLIVYLMHYFFSLSLAQFLASIS